MPTTVELIKAKIDIVDIVRDSVDLRRSGSHYKGMCPFHSNTQTPAFVIFPDSQSWRCFGACQEGGDVISFIMKARGWRFREALEYLASVCGVAIQRPDQRRAQQEHRLHSALQEAERFYHEILLSGDEGKWARRYLRRRGLGGNVVRQFRLGYAPAGWDNIKQYLLANGYREQEMIDAGLLSTSEIRRTTYDRFRERVVFPIYDERGQVVGFAGRSLQDTKPKYVNTPKTLLFHKSSYLYGLDKVTREEEDIVVVEGYMDVLQGWQQGKHNIVSQMGTALTARQIKLLRSLRCKRILIATDGDEAGRVSILKNGPRLLAEAQHYGLEVGVIPLPDGKDPDDLLLHETARWDHLVEAAQPIVEYVIRVVTHGLDTVDVSAKVAAANQAAPILATLSSGIARAHYRQALAARLGVAQDDIPRADAVSPPCAPPAVTNICQPPTTNLPQARFVGQCMKTPMALQMVNEVLASVGQLAVEAREFEQVEDRVIINRLTTLRNDFSDVAERVEQLAALPVQSAQELHDLPRRLAISALKWRQQRAKENLVVLGERLQLDNGCDAEEKADSMHRLEEIPQTLSQLMTAERELLAKRTFPDAS